MQSCLCKRGSIIPLWSAVSRSRLSNDASLKIWYNIAFLFTRPLNPHPLTTNPLSHVLHFPVWLSRHCFIIFLLFSDPLIFAPYLPPSFNKPSLLINFLPINNSRFSNHYLLLSERLLCRDFFGKMWARFASFNELKLIKNDFLVLVFQ